MMSNETPPKPEPDKGPDPYATRNHESTSLNKSDSIGIASLLGHVAGSLNEIDKRNIGGNTSFTRARKIDPTSAYKQIMGTDPSQQQSAPADPRPSTQPVQTINNQHIQHSNTTLIEERLAKLEKLIDTLNIPLKFKRGISYNITTAKIKGTFSDPVQILDILSTELSKQTKSITLKLNDTTKNKQQV